jgi:hypothetical protein
VKIHLPWSGDPLDKALNRTAGSAISGIYRGGLYGTARAGVAVMLKRFSVDGVTVLARDFADAVRIVRGGK